MRYLITGGCGFLGSNLTDQVLRKGDSVFVFDNLSRLGSTQNLAYLKRNPNSANFNFVHGDIRSTNDVERIVHQVRPEVIFHLAGQVAMTTSISDPRKDFETNVMGGFNILESARKWSPDATIIYSSTNKVYGDLEHISYEEASTRYLAIGYEKGFSEDLSLDFRSPYGCSKGAMDQYMLDYARVFNMNTVVLRHSSIFGARQFSTSDQGWIGWFVQKAIEAMSEKPAEFTISGNGKQVRDVLFAPDIVSCYFKATDKIQTIRGQAFNIGGGVENSLSLLELFAILEEELGVVLKYRQLPWRQSDQKVFIADIRKAKSLFDWSPTIDKRTGVRQMIEWVKFNE